MLLNELKTVFDMRPLFELDRTPLADTLAGFDINVGGHGGKDKGGDADDSVKELVEKGIVVMPPPAPGDVLIRSLTKDPAQYEKTMSSLGVIARNLRKLQQDFTEHVLSQPQLSGLKIDDQTSQEWIGRIITDVAKGYTDSNTFHRNSKKLSNVFLTRREQLTRTIMKLSQAEGFSQHSMAEIKHFLNSSEYKVDKKTGATEVDGAASGITQLKDHLEMFYLTVGSMAQNVLALEGMVKGQAPDKPAASKDAPAPTA